MPSKLKKLVRERMARTGERYAAALRHVRARAVQTTTAGAAASASTQQPAYQPDLIVARYFGRPVTFAIVPMGGRCVLTLAPSAGHPITETPRARWRFLQGQGVQ